MKTEALPEVRFNTVDRHKIDDSVILSCSAGQEARVSTPM